MFTNLPSLDSGFWAAIGAALAGSLYAAGRYVLTNKAIVDTLRQDTSEMKAGISTLISHNHKMEIKQTELGTKIDILMEERK
jgi:hypothetical protein